MKHVLSWKNAVLTEILCAKFNLLPKKNILNSRNIPRMNLVDHLQYENVFRPVVSHVRPFLDLGYV